MTERKALADDQATYRQMAAAERKLADTIAERALAHPDPSQTKFLRMLWTIANARAGYFEEFAVLRSEPASP